jgi:hypothetical protein
MRLQIRKVTKAAETVPFKQAVYRPAVLPVEHGFINIKRD